MATYSHSLMLAVRVTCNFQSMQKAKIVCLNKSNYGGQRQKCYQELVGQAPNHVIIVTANQNGHVIETRTGPPIHTSRPSLKG